jgi:hypothetical protein
MHIAKGITASEYKQLRLADFASDDWLTAIGYLEKRLSERYTEPADVLVETEKYKSPLDKKYGFTVIAIDCMLAETIQSFYDGVTNSSGSSKKIFVRFLRHRDHFKSFFSTDQEAEHFYINFRCGILHQSQTFGDTKVWAVGQLIQRIGKDVIVNREAFHAKIKDELSIYLTELRKRKDSILLQNFRKKMDFISGV